jgi:Tfp pilus assembly protein PilO
MKTSNTQVTIAVAILGTLVVASFAFCLALPAYRESLETKKGLIEAESQVLAQYNSRQKLSETVNRIKTARNILENLKGEFLANGTELELITAVEGIGDTHQVVTNFRISPNGGGASLPEYDKGYTLSLTGTYSKVMDALVDFERLPFLTTYDSLSLTSGGDGADPAVTLELRGFVASPPTNL